MTDCSSMGCVLGSVKRRDRPPGWNGRRHQTEREYDASILTAMCACTRMKSMARGQKPCSAQRIGAFPHAWRQSAIASPRRGRALPTTAHQAQSSASHTIFQSHRCTSHQMQRSNRRCCRALLPLRKLCTLRKCRRLRSWRGLSVAQYIGGRCLCVVRASFPRSRSRWSALSASQAGCHVRGLFGLRTASSS